MKIAAVSDLHGYLPDIPEVDVLCICGDIVPLDIQKNIEASKYWFKNRFAEWIKKQPIEKCLIVPGNHDFALLDIYEDSDSGHFLWECDMNDITGKTVCLLIDETRTINGIKFYGTPWIQQIHPDKSYWAFEYDYKKVLEIPYKQIPEDTDILLTHESPNENHGLNKYRKYKYFHFFGHWHDGHFTPHTGEYNVAVKDDYYYIKGNYKIPIFEIMTKEDEDKMTEKVITAFKEFIKFKFPEETDDKITYLNENEFRSQVLAVCDDFLFEYTKDKA